MKLKGYTLQFIIHMICTQDCQLNFLFFFLQNFESVQDFLSAQKRYELHVLLTQANLQKRFNILVGKCNWQENSRQLENEDEQKSVQLL